MKTPDKAKKSQQLPQKTRPAGPKVTDQYENSLCDLITLNPETETNRQA